MIRTLRALFIVGIAIVAVSCSMPQMPVISQGSAATATDGQTAAATPKVMTDTARNQAVYVDETGAAIDIAATEPDGSTVAGTEAVGLAVVADESRASKGLTTGSGEQLRAIVVGTRSDGRGGIWTVVKGGSVLPAGQEYGSGNGSGLPDCDDHDKGMRGGLGWTYTVTGISDDGRMVVGNATNVKGYHHGGISIDPNTTVGVYWRVSRISHRPYVQVSAARVIGTLDTSKLPQKKGHHGRPHYRGMLKWLSHLQLFMLDYFTTYLIEADSVTRDSARSVYVVTGADQDGNDATATIDSSGSIVITPATTPTDLPDLKVSSITVPSAAQRSGAAWTLGANIANAGSADAGSFTLLYQVSSKSTLDSTATTIGTKTVPSLAAGATYSDTWSTSFSIADGGTHWIFVTVDSASAVAESDETNNTSSASVPIIYSHIVIDTYLPVYNYGTSVMTVVSLFGPSGDTTTDLPDLWNTDSPPYTTETSALAENGDVGAYGSIDYTDGLAPGTYYVRVRGLTSSQVGAYGIRVLTTAADAPTGSTWSWYFTAANPTDANPAGGSYESDNNPLQGGVPTNPVAITVNDKLNRWISAGNIGGGTPGDVDWFRLTLP